MIKKINDFKCLSGVSSPLLPVIFSAFSFYAEGVNGAYIQENEDGEATCAFSLEGNSVHLALFDDYADFDELSSFFRLSGVKYVCSDGLLFIHFSKVRIFDILSCKPFSFDDCRCGFLNGESRAEDYKGVFDASFSENEFEDWYPLFSRKINLSMAEGCFMKNGSSVISCACAPFIGEKDAVISGVGTVSEERNKGFGSRCVSVLMDKLKKRELENAYLWCEKDKVDFYERLGFVKIGKIIVGECRYDFF